VTSFYVYVIEAQDDRGRRFFYVGSSAKTPDERFREHRDGKRYCKGGCRGNKKHVHGVKLRLCRELFAPYNPIRSRDEAEEIERWLARHIRKRGYRVVSG
jgi:predicted GIY-YIG superfamily endonuclease